MKVSQSDLKRFEEYESYWRTVLIEVLGWTESDFVQFVEKRKAWLFEWGGIRFFHDEPDKYVNRFILSPVLKKRLVGLSVLRAGRLLMSAIADKNHRYDLPSPFDVPAAQSRYKKMQTRLERLTKQAPKISGAQ